MEMALDRRKGRVGRYTQRVGSYMQKVGGGKGSVEQNAQDRGESKVCFIFTSWLIQCMKLLMI